ncbi:hypothetical protein CONPUDRAFT_75369 [Coniophora puteana RWD-64-598 SS2]|uniref:Uncharacterized protein n=1 Tax=Coniophora puteana (strain RWD-64-598) TaxID=741705 RepID=A0A5M3MEC6_CONPW|nr:uncharacterized protein CONPUDRAFT_75369 [Coniophora puteana RWD-64-598 SS2]EIW77503.1 hypothetical protein CONPUDRAFT_75369 [Coniophora puteana RWD-64-598 SS2]
MTSFPCLHFTHRMQAYSSFSHQEKLFAGCQAWFVEARANGFSARLGAFNRFYVVPAKLRVRVGTEMPSGNSLSSPFLPSPYNTAEVGPKVTKGKSKQKKVCLPPMPAPTIILSAKAPELPTEAPTASDVTLPAAASTIADAPVISLEDRSATLAPIEDTSAVLATSTATPTPAENVEAPPPVVVPDPSRGSATGNERRVFVELGGSLIVPWSSASSTSSTACRANLPPGAAAQVETDSAPTCPSDESGSNHMQLIPDHNAPQPRQLQKHRKTRRSDSTVNKLDALYIKQLRVVVDDVKGFLLRISNEHAALDASRRINSHGVSSVDRTRPLAKRQCRHRTRCMPRRL